MKQKQNLFVIFFFLLCLIFVTSCLSKKYTKKGIEFEQMGLKIEAAEYYYQALVKKNDNIEAKVGLKRTGQAVLEDRLNQFNEAYNNGNNKLTVENYEKAQNYFQTLANLGVNLNFPSQYQQFYEDAKTIYLEELYLKAVQLLDNHEFNSAETTLRNILSLNIDYRDCKEKLEIAICEPKYLNIIQLIEENRYRSAYSKILELQKLYNSYKDISDLKRECLEKGSVSIVIPPITSKYENKAVSESFRFSLIRGLQNLNDPFLHIVENETSGTTSKTLVLRCEIQSMNYSAGKLAKTEEKGWLRKVLVNKETGEKKTEYSKVNYYIFQQKRNLSLNVNYSLTDQRSTQILSSNSKNLSASDAINYATFDGDHKNLVSGYWKNKLNFFNSKEDRVDDNWVSNSNLKNLLNASKTIKDYNTLLEEVNSEFVNMVTRDVKKYFENE